MGREPQKEFDEFLCCLIDINTDKWLRLSEQMVRQRWRSEAAVRYDIFVLALYRMVSSLMTDMKLFEASLYINSEVFSTVIERGVWH